MEYYIVQFDDENSTKYAIWYTDDEDGFICEEGKILFFDSLKLLKEFCNTQKIIITDEDEIPFVYDLVYLKNWLRTPGENFDCSDMLDFWNMISDALKNIGIAFLGDCKDGEDVNIIYDKLFHGCNLPAYSTSGRKYVPEWTKEEIGTLQKVLSQYEFFWY